MQRITMGGAFLAMSVFFTVKFGWRPVMMVDRTAGYVCFVPEIKFVIYAEECEIAGICGVAIYTG